MAEKQTPKEQAKGFAYLIVLVLILWFGIRSCAGCGEDDTKDKSTTTTPTKSKEELRQEEIERHFSAWDGSHKVLTEKLKVLMNDPDSYENVETKFIDKDSFLLVFQTFSGKNAFGGRVKQKVMAQIDFNDNIISVIELDPFTDEIKLPEE